MLFTCTTALSSSMKLWAMLCRTTQDGRVMVESSDKCGPLEKGMANHFSILALRTPWTVWKGKTCIVISIIPSSPPFATVPSLTVGLTYFLYFLFFINSIHGYYSQSTERMPNWLTKKIPIKEVPICAKSLMLNHNILCVSGKWNHRFPNTQDHRFYQTYIYIY